MLHLTWHVNALNQLHHWPEAVGTLLERFDSWVSMLCGNDFSVIPVLPLP